MDLKPFRSTGNGVRHRGHVISVFVSSSRNRLLTELLQLGHVTTNCVLLKRSIIEGPQGKTAAAYDTSTSGLRTAADYSALMFDSRATRVHFSTSLASNLPNSARDVAATSAPSFSSRCFDSGVPSTAPISRFSLSATAFGVPAGA